MKYILSLIFALITLVAPAQKEDLNQYKYIIVENQYEFQEEANEYRFNELAVFEFKKRNFNAFNNTGVLPEDLNRGECNALQLKIDKSGVFRVSLTLRLENCKGETVFTSHKGIGTTKSFDKAYFEALRDAMTSFDEVDYKYSKPLFTKTLENSELKVKGVDSIKTMTGEPGKNSIVLNETKDKPSFEKTVQDAPQKTMETQIAMLKTDYVSLDKNYFLIKTKEGFDIYKSDKVIGTLKKNKRGSYLVVTTEFIGIGYESDKGLSVEYTKDDKEIVIDFIKQ